MIRALTDIRQSQNWASYLKSIGWQIEKIDNCFVYIKNLPLFGSIIKIQRPNILPLIDKVKKTAKKYRAISVKIEPKDQKQVIALENFGFKKNSWPMLPSKTIFIDLKKSENRLLSEMHHKTRYNINLAIRKKLKVETGNQISKFAKLWKNNMRRRGFWWISTNDLEKLFVAFKNHVKIVLVKKGETPLAGVFVVWDNKVAYYMYAASSIEGNKLFAPTLAAWEAIRLAKNKGCKFFDFEGIYDERYHASTKNWQGFSRFKKGFGGEDFEFPMALSKSRLIKSPIF